MELLEIRNNLIKLSFSNEETPALGQFITINADDKSYVAQFVNIKCDEVHQNAVAKLIFTYTNDGIVDEYDGSIPSISSATSKLSANELLDLIPVETPIKIGQLSPEKYMLNVDISVFEHNFTVFCEHDFERATVISNLARQLFRMKEKSIIIDTDSIFENYPIIKLGQDFKLPLNSEMIDFIFEYELKDVEVSTKAVIQDIFYEVQRYVNTLQDKFIPIETFIDVVTDQYKETQMPELALLKNKLIKYRDANIFADTKDEIDILKEMLTEKNCLVIDLSEINEELQKEVITHIHKIIETFDKYVYFFVPVNDDNSDKKLIRRLINHEHVFTTLFASHTYKYAQELKSHSQNMLLFAPMTSVHDFAAYNTFLAKLNSDEAIMYGKLTQNIPFIINIEDLDLDLTKDDVFGDKTTFVPAIEESSEIEDIKQKSEDIIPEVAEDNSDISDESESESELEVEDEDEVVLTSEVPTEQEESPQEETVTDLSEFVEELPTAETDVIDIESTDLSEFDSEELSEDLPLTTDFTDTQETETSSDNIIQPVENLMQTDNETITDESYEELDADEFFPADTIEDTENSELTEDDLDFIESNQIISDSEDENNNSDLEDFMAESEEPTEQNIVPVYSPEENVESTNEFGYKQGDSVSHPRYGNGVVEKIIKYGNKTLCSINFENVGRRLLDPTISDLEKV